MEKFEEYLAAFDGSTDWASVEPLFEDAFHADCIFVTADGEFDKTQWLEMVKGLRAKGTVASDFQVNKTDGDSVYYQLTLSAGGGEPLELKAKGLLSDGRLIRVEPVDPAAYSEMVRQSE